jgi:hypothetical protein
MLNLLITQDRTERMMNLHYQITVQEYLEESWSDWFDSLRITHASNGATTLAGAVRDQTALYGILAKLRDLGLTLLSVTPDPPAPATEGGT